MSLLKLTNSTNLPSFTTRPLQNIDPVLNDASVESSVPVDASVETTPVARINRTSIEAGRRINRASEALVRNQINARDNGTTITGQSNRRSFQLADNRAASAAPSTPDSALPKDEGDALVVVYPDYPITIPGPARPLVGMRYPIDENGKAPLGHADVVTWPDAQGGKVKPKLHQYGRYESNAGQVRSFELPIELDVDPATRDLTPQSREKLLSYLSKNHGHGGRIEAAKLEHVNLDAIDAFAKGHSQNGDYDIFKNNCGTFAWDAANAGAYDPEEKSGSTGRSRNQVPVDSMKGAENFSERITWSPNE